MSIVEAYSDGGVIGQNPSDCGGTWAYCHIDGDGEREGWNQGLLVTLGEFRHTDLLHDSITSYIRSRVDCYDLPAITNNLTEMFAAVRCLNALPCGWSGKFYCDSNITLGRIFKNWKMAGIPAELADEARTCLHRLGKVMPVLLGGHPTKADLVTGVRAVRAGKSALPCSIHNVWCDEECGRIGAEYLKQRLAASR